MRFSSTLITWYNDHKRDLPWRNTSDPYTIWLSEIILQQTRVDQGMSYFLKFKQHYPSIDLLAKADEQEVLNLWQGLGYYSRARNMHQAAQYVMGQCNGQFPSTYKAILDMKGVGEYTASAISSFAYGLPHAVVDGNVYRVLARLFGIDQAIDSTAGKKTFSQLAHELLNLDEPGIHNQAIMEFGALQCTPKQPKCETCPFVLECVAFNNKQVAELPFKAKKTKVRARYFHYLVFRFDDQLLLSKRGEKDIWQGLFDFPLIETTDQLVSDQKLIQLINKQFSPLKVNTLSSKSTGHKHILSHQRIYANFYEISVKNLADITGQFTKINIQEINNYPVPKLIENYIKAIF